MLYLLDPLRETDGWQLVFSLFESITFRAAAAGATAFLICVVLFPALIRFLRAHGIVEDTSHPDSTFLTEAHGHKKGMPTMGGIGILVGILGAGLLWADLTNTYVIVAMAVTLALGCLGAVDDIMKIRKIGRRGMPGRIKLGFQVLIATAAVGVLYHFGDGPFPATKLAIPFLKPDLFAPDLGWLYVPFAVVVIVGCSNAVNLPAGLDGLAAGCTSVSALVYAALAYLAGHAALAGYLNIPFVRGSGELVILCTALAGAAIGFLWYNAHPAQVFMGDTGSLAMGGLIGVVACAAKQEILLVFVGGVFVIEAASVIIQVGSFKLFGRRVFLISPFHHHLVEKGWSESKVVVRFWILSVLCALVSVASLKVR